MHSKQQTNSIKRIQAKTILIRMIFKVWSITTIMGISQRCRTTRTRSSRVLTISTILRRSMMKQLIDCQLTWKTSFERNWLLSFQSKLNLPQTSTLKRNDIQDPKTIKNHKNWNGLTICRSDIGSPLTYDILFYEAINNKIIDKK